MVNVITHYHTKCLTKHPWLPMLLLSLLPDQDDWPSFRGTTNGTLGNQYLAK